LWSFANWYNMWLDIFSCFGHRHFVYICHHTAAEVTKFYGNSEGPSQLLTWLDWKNCLWFQLWLLFQVDLDPYGSPSVFLDSAVQSVADGGMLMCTATDMAVLCGGNGEVCYSKWEFCLFKQKFQKLDCMNLFIAFWNQVWLLSAERKILSWDGSEDPPCLHWGNSTSSDNFILCLCVLYWLWSHISMLQSHANRYKRYIVPILSVQMDFYIRVFVRIYTCVSPFTTSEFTCLCTLFWLLAYDMVHICIHKLHL